MGLGTIAGPFHLPRLLLSVLRDLIIATHCKKTKLKGKN